MSKEEIKDILEELHLVRPEILKPKAKKLFEAIICIADERDILLEQNQKYKEVIDKAIKYIEQHAITVTDGTVTTNKHELLEILKEVE